MSELLAVEVTPRAASRLRAGHPWVFAAEVHEAKEAQPGQVVRLVVHHRGGGHNLLGRAFYSPRSLIRLRLIDREGEPPDRDFWRARLRQALALREALRTPDTALRLVYSEADALPGLVVDRYADVLVVQFLCAGTEALREMFLDLLEELLHPRAIVERDDTHARELEGLPEKSGLVRGALDEPVEILEGGLRLRVDPRAGQKTGHYLDQRENRQAAAAYARGRCLDAFCYQGGFGLHLARGGAEEVLLLDQSEEALGAARQHAAQNELEVKTRAGNAFDVLRELQRAGEKFSVVVLDPPAFAKNRAALAGAVRGYKELNLRAMHLLEEGGTLITSSCSYHMLPERFEEVVQQAARDAGRRLQLLERRSASRDHPERPGFPEARYLKCLILRVL
ncbi:MAG: class I SAM-dependent rRNA methyltransferase [Myxococcales bacterium]|nr:class I SAM-dependent rRNA methyltransferase [Myxococcales bacterium]